MGLFTQDAIGRHDVQEAVEKVRAWIGQSVHWIGRVLAWRTSPAPLVALLLLLLLLLGGEGAHTSVASRLLHPGAVTASPPATPSSLLLARQGQHQLHLASWNDSITGCVSAIQTRETVCFINLVLRHNYIAPASFLKCQCEHPGILSSAYAETEKRLYHNVLILPCCLLRRH